MTEEAMNKPVWFREWVEALGADVRIPHAAKQGCRLAIGSYLGHLKASGKRAMPATAKAYCDAAHEAGADHEEARKAVRWFFREALARELLRPRSARTPVVEEALSVETVRPVIVAERGDHGRTPWEQKLVERLRRSITSGGRDRQGDRQSVPFCWLRNAVLTRNPSMASSICWA